VNVGPRERRARLARAQKSITHALDSIRALDKHSRRVLAQRFGGPDVEDCIALGVAFVAAIGQMIDTIV
jgi:hypothetical protein